MNQVESKSAYQGPVLNPVLGEADAKLLHAVLIRGDQAVARQKDLIEMHKRLVNMFTTLKVGLGEQQARKAAQDRKALVQRLEEMERAVNGMEGVLRIEMAPQLEQMLDAALERRLPRPGRRRFRFVGLVLAVLAGLTLGTLYSEPIKQETIRAVAKLELFSGFNSGFVPK